MSGMTKTINGPLFHRLTVCWCRLLKSYFWTTFLILIHFNLGQCLLHIWCKTSFLGLNSTTNLLILFMGDLCFIFNINLNFQIFFQSKFFCLKLNFMDFLQIVKIIS